MIHHLGLEYFIEIQHNTVKKMVPDYCCMLCDANIKKGSKDKKSILEVARNHLKSSAHKLKFMVGVWLHIRCVGVWLYKW